MEYISEIIPFAKNHPILTLAWVLILVAIIYLTIKNAFSKVKMIGNSMAVNFINKEDAVIVDIRNNDNFRLGHITGAHNILPIDIKNGSVKQLEKFKDNPIIIVCDNGTVAAASGELLVKAGFPHVYALKDGVAGWNGDNLPLVKSK